MKKGRVARAAGSSLVCRSVVQQPKGLLFLYHIVLLLLLQKSRNVEMKRFFLFTAALLGLISASAQNTTDVKLPDTDKGHLFSGIAFDVSFKNEGSTVDGGSSSSSYKIVLSPQIGWAFNEKLWLGTRIGFTMNSSKTVDIIQAINDIADNEEAGEVNINRGKPRKDIGWVINPFVRYKILTLGARERLGVWVEGHVFFGMEYPNMGEGDHGLFSDFKRRSIYGAQVLPVASFSINKNTSLYVHLALLSIGYAGSTTVYDGYKEYSNTALMFTGRIGGLLNVATTDGLYAIKVGLARTF